MDPQASRFRAARNAPRDVLLEVVRPYVEGDDWDRPHRFLAICWDGSRCWVEQESLAPLTMNPERMNRLIMSRAAMAFERQKEAMDAGVPPTLYAVALVTEAHMVYGLEPGASQWERARMRRDRAERRFFEREDAIEMRTAWVADIDRRVHHATVRADRPGEPMSCGTLDRDGEFADIGGTIPAFLCAAAMANAHLLYGEPVPNPQAPQTAGDVVPLRQPS